MTNKQNFRHELKYRITQAHKDIMMARLDMFLDRDNNTENGIYQIRSLYFDDYWNSAYEEKQMGTAVRKKYRIRFYNYSDELIKLECKHKQGAYIYKQSARLTTEEVRNILAGNYEILRERKLMERAVPQGTPESMIVKVHETFTEHYKKHCADKTRPYDGIKELIENIRNAGVYTAVVSNKADYGVQALCKDYFPGLFDYAVGEREGIRRKPYPDSVNEVLRQFDVDRTQAVYVGDSEVDVQTAANAGMDVCMVGWGFRDEEFLKDNGAEFVVHSPEEAWEFINK